MANLRTFTPEDIEAWKWNNMAGSPGDPQVTAAGLARQKASNAARDGGYAFNPDAAPGVYDPNASTIGAKGTLAGGGTPGATTNAAPLPPTQLPPVGATTNTIGGRTFGGQAPTPTPYGAFVAPDHATFNRSGDSLYLQGQQQKAIQRAGAARGTLLSGGLLNRLQENAVGLAGQDYQNQFNRDLLGYTTNRDTNAQNFDQQMGQFRGGLEVFGANTNAALGFGRLDLEAAQANRNAAAQDADRQAAYRQSLAGYDAMNNAQNAAAVQELSDQYAQWVNQQRQAYAARPTVPVRVAPTRGVLNTRPRSMGWG